MNRIWAYVISKPLDDSGMKQLQASGTGFVESWSAHENKLAASFGIVGNRIIVVKVNEDVHGASGCSIDKLTRFVKDTEAAFGVELLNRFLVAYKGATGVEVVHSSKIKELLAQGIISENTIVYNTAAANEAELNAWEQPLKNTWLSKYLVKA
jgi:hypothetical protein